MRMADLAGPPGHPRSGRRPVPLAFASKKSRLPVPGVGRVPRSTRGGEPQEGCTPSQGPRPGSAPGDRVWTMARDGLEPPPRGSQSEAQGAGPAPFVKLSSAASFTRQPKFTGATPPSTTMGSK